MNSKTVKSIGSVVAGFLTVVILSMGTDVVVEGMGILPPATQPESYTDAHLLIALIYRRFIPLQEDMSPRYWHHQQIQ